MNGIQKLIVKMMIKEAGNTALKILRDECRRRIIASRFASENGSSKLNLFNTGVFVDLHVFEIEFLSYLENIIKKREKKEKKA
jgi:hypothetical protein